jgi:hypothetical protein
MIFLFALVLSGVVGRAQAQGCLVAGEYNAQPVASYSCCMGIVSFNLSRLTFSDLGGGQVSVAASGLPALVGSLDCADGRFDVIVTLPGGCAEQYRLVGQFSSPGQWSGTFTATYVGSDCSCFGIDPCSNRQWSLTGTSKAVSVGDAGVPALRLAADPNPFRSSVAIRLELDRAARTEAEILDLGGRSIAVLCDQTLAPGTHRLDWSRTTRTGTRAPSGLYFLRVRVVGETRLRKLVIVD